MGTDHVILNVGGARFHTTIDTLSRTESCMLSNLVSGNWKECGAGSKDEIFIDRDGTYFRYILNYFRSAGQPIVLPAENQQIEELLVEAEYYCLEGLAQQLRAKVTSAQDQKASSDPTWDELLRVIDKLEHAQLFNGGVLMAGTLRDFVGIRSQALMVAYRAYKDAQQPVLAEKLQSVARERLFEFSQFSPSKTPSPARNPSSIPMFSPGRFN